MAGTVERFEIGRVRCAVLLDAEVPVPARALLPDLDREEIQARTGVEADDELPGVVTALLVERDDQIVLVDTGLGPERGGAVHARLADMGIDHAAVGAVTLSHAHGDHIGGALTDDGAPAFPNARHVVHEAERRFWLDPVWENAEAGPHRLPMHVAATARRVLPTLEAAGLVDVVDRETAVAPGIRMVPAPGHTPGHVAVAIADGVNELLWVADAFVHVSNVAEPSPASIMDTDRALTVATRLDLLERAAQRRAILAATHFRERGRVVRDGDGDRYRLER